MKKIIPALALLLISAMVLASASYAWFSMNTTVTATGMQVTAEAPTSLLISVTSATEGFGSTVTLANDTANAATKFKPVSYAGVCANWYMLTSNAMATVNENGRVIIANFTEVADGSGASSFTGATFDHDSDNATANVDIYESADTMVYHDQVWLKVEGKDNKDVKAQAEWVTGTDTQNVRDAMHIVFVVNNAVKATIDMGTDAQTDTAVLASLTANAASGTLIDIYYFLSGNDADCKNTNINQDSTLSVDLTFTAVDPTSSNSNP